MRIDMCERSKSLIKQREEQLSIAIVKKFEDVLKSAITKKLGREDWKTEDLKGRLHKTVCNRKIETYYLDEVPLVEFYPPSFSTDNFMGKHTLSVTQNYRMLYK